MQPKSYLVIGGGLVGAASALRLQAAGFAVTLIDPGDPRRAASFGNIGHIAAEQVSPLASRESLRTFPGRLFGLGGALDFRWRDAGLWGPWALRFIAASNPGRHARGQAALTAILAHALPAWRRLAEFSGAPGVVGPDGHVVVWMEERAAEKGLRAWERTSTGSAAFRPMSPEDLAPYATVMKDAPVAGIRFSGTAQVSEPPKNILQFLVALIVHRNAQLLQPLRIGRPDRQGRGRRGAQTTRCASMKYPGGSGPDTAIAPRHREAGRNP